MKCSVLPPRNTRRLWACAQHEGAPVRKPSVESERFIFHIELKYFCHLSGIESDIIDEAIYYFKANVFFKNYEIKVTHMSRSPDWETMFLLGERHYIPFSLSLVLQLTSQRRSGTFLTSVCLFQNEADRTLIYVTLYISECLKRLQKVTHALLNEESGDLKCRKMTKQNQNESKQLTYGSPAVSEWPVFDWFPAFYIKVLYVSRPTGAHPRVLHV